MIKDIIWEILEGSDLIPLFLLDLGPLNEVAGFMIQHFELKFPSFMAAYLEYKNLFEKLAFIATM